jgi:hypothetical protein
VPNKLLAMALACTLTGGIALLGCGSDDPQCDSCIGAGGAGSGSGSVSSASTTSGGGGSQCNGTRGTLTGDAYLWSAPGEPDSQPAPGALIALRKSPEDIPLYGMADEQGHYELEIPPGDWLVTGDDGTGCTTDQPKAVTVEPCGFSELDIVIDLCFG